MGFSASCFSTESFEPEDSVTKSLPRSSKHASMGRSTKGCPAASDKEYSAGNVKFLSPKVAVSAEQAVWRSHVAQTMDEWFFIGPSVAECGKAVAPTKCQTGMDRE